jgi:mono/diheme cytochrome c family protein
MGAGAGGARGAGVDAKLRCIGETNPYGGQAVWVRDRARRLRETSQVTDLASCGPYSPSQRGPATVVGIRLTNASELSCAIVFLGILTASFGAAAQAPTRTPGQLPDGPGKATFESVCSLCHVPNAPAGKQWTREQWELKVIEMLQEEPDVTADERTQIVEYLTATFKPRPHLYQPRRGRGSC